MDKRMVIPFTNKKTLLSLRKSKTTTKKAPEVSVVGGDEGYRLFVEGVKEYAMIMLDMKGYVIGWNIGAENLLGYKEKAIVGKHFSRLFTQEDRKADKPKLELEQALETGRGEDENWLVRRDKSQFWASGMSTPLRDKAGNLLGFAKIIRDLSERKELEQQKDDFISMASHELKTPLTSIKAYAQILHKHLEQISETKGLSHLTKIQEQITKQENLIRDLLNVSKIQSGMSDYQTEEFNLDSLVKDTAKELEATAPTHIIVVVGKTSHKVRAIKEHIGQVLTNFLTNAIKYSPEAKKINVRLSEDKKSVTVSVEDFGMGIPKEQKKRVFDRFYRSENVKTKSLSGYGLGLYIASQIIKQYKGQIKVESIEGKGSIFSFSLPLVKQK
mgnify:CR=1 FL=1